MGHSHPPRESRAFQHNCSASTGCNRLRVSSWMCKMRCGGYLFGNEIPVFLVSTVAVRLLEDARGSSVEGSGDLPPTLTVTGSPHSQMSTTPKDPTVGLCVGS